MTQANPAARPWLLIPVKPLGEGKSRLASQLMPAERAAVSQRMLGRLLEIAVGSPALAGVLVVSRDPRVLALATEAGALPLTETSRGINAALTQAAAAAAQQGAQAVMVLPADLPLITAEDIAALAQALPTPTGVCLVASHDGGTNALVMRPIGAIAFAFGEQSFQRHLDLAQAAKVPIHTINSPTLAIDLDRPADLWAVGEPSTFATAGS